MISLNLKYMFCTRSKMLFVNHCTQHQPRLNQSSPFGNNYLVWLPEVQSDLLFALQWMLKVCMIGTDRTPTNLNIVWGTDNGSNRIWTPWFGSIISLGVRFPFSCLHLRLQLDTGWLNRWRISMDFHRLFHSWDPLSFSVWLLPLRGASVSCFPSVFFSSLAKAGVLLRRTSRCSTS